MFKHTLECRKHRHDSKKVKQKEVGKGKGHGDHGILRSAGARALTMEVGLGYTEWPAP